MSNVCKFLLYNWEHRSFVYLHWCEKLGCICICHLLVTDLYIHSPACGLYQLFVLIFMMRWVKVCSTQAHYRYIQICLLLYYFSICADEVWNCICIRSNQAHYPLVRPSEVDISNFECCVLDFVLPLHCYSKNIF